MSIRDYVFSGDINLADVLGDYIDIVPKKHDVISISKSDVEAMAKHFGLIDEWVSVDCAPVCVGEEAIVCIQTVGGNYINMVSISDDGDLFDMDGGYIGYHASQVTLWKPVQQPPKGNDK